MNIVFAKYDTVLSGKKCTTNLEKKSAASIFTVVRSQPVSILQVYRPFKKTGITITICKFLCFLHHGLTCLIVEQLPSQLLTTTN